jgi:energy-coupling factor transporter ATP-binding protein EcfA2
VSSLRPIEEALKLPSGACYRRCSPRLRPYGPAGGFAGDEAAYNAGIADALRGQRVEMAAVLADEIEALPLRQALEAAGLDVVVASDPELQQGLADLPAADIAHPDQAAADDAWCWTKTSECTAEALRQAVLDPDSRIRPAAAEVEEARCELLAMSFQSGGFLGDMAIRFNDNLNVLVGGRGTGKSTLIESLRYVLDREVLGEEARKSHAGIVRNVLRSGTRISLLVRSHRPAERDYLIERTVPNPPVVRSAGGEVLDLTPEDVLPGIEIYGQHEIAELVRNPDKLTRLLERFVRRDDASDERRGELAGELAASRRRVLDLRRELLQVEDRLASLPALEETLQRFEEAGLEDKLGERSLLVREEQILRSAGERLRPLRDVLTRLGAALPLEREQLKPDALADLPGKWILAQAEPALAELEASASRLQGDLQAALDRAEAALADIDARFAQRRASVQESYEATLRELQQSRVDGEEFIRLRQQIERLRPLKERESQLRQELAAEDVERRRRLAALEDDRADVFHALERAADRVNQQLVGRVRVRLTYAGHRDPLFTLLREQVGGRLSESIDALRRREALSLGELVAACRAGREALVEKFAMPPSQAERLAQAEPATLMEIEELELEATTAIELNVGGWGGSVGDPVWQPLENLSTGQKATAVLLLLLLESEAPLVVDQPEDDLDNRFIADGIVPKMREEKRRRQFLFATHNANIPVIGDAELILGLTATGEAGKGRASIAREHMGSIDSPAVQELVGEILEGGRNAFEMRRRKYGF